jgi:glycolate oxidase iron-sulfur subunit
MHEYSSILKGTTHETAAKALSDRVCDISVFLTRLGCLECIPNSGKTIRIAYHDACHLSNAQGVVDEPRSLLRLIPGAEVVEIPNGSQCCGSAGSYNLDQPEIAASLGRAKAEGVLSTDADIVASGNIGCLTQIKAHIGERPIPIRHTIQILRDAYNGRLHT